VTNCVLVLAGIVRSYIHRLIFGINQFLIHLVSLILISSFSFALFFALLLFFVLFILFPALLLKIFIHRLTEFTFTALSFPHYHVSHFHVSHFHFSHFQRPIAKLLNGTVFNYFERPLTQISRLRHLTLNFSTTVYEIETYSYNGILTGTYTCDLE